MTLFHAIALCFLFIFSSSFGTEASVKKIFQVPTLLPKDQEVCFSPDEHCDQKLLKFLDSAEKSIDIAIFDITLDQVAHLLLVKSKKIALRVILDRRQAKGAHSLARTLVRGGAVLRLGTQRGLMHHKFAIIDNKALETGSFNYTNNAARFNQENQIYLWSPTIIDRFKKRFDTMWSESKPFKI